jgi:dienelactone hydrolase
MIMRIMAAFIITSCFLSIAHAGLVTETVAYKHGDTELEGYLAFDPSRPGKRPGVLVVHEWWGLNDYARMRAEQLAEMGYVAFALDMYGKGVNTTDAGEAAKLSGQFKGKPLLAERARAGLEVLMKHEKVDPDRVAAIGFCFGGTTVLELAYTGADLAGVVSFHGNPTVPKDPAKISARVLVLHGADDFFVSDESIKAFQDAMRKGKVDWQMIYYGGAVHAFTNPAADKAGIKGVAYQEKAARRSWKHMQDFFSEIFASE